MICYEYRVNEKSGFNLGVDFMYDPGKYKIAEALQLNIENSFRNLHQWGIVFGHELYINKVGVLIQYGRYLHDPLHLDRNAYQRYACRYYFSPTFFGGLALKAHSGSADWVEWGMGYKF